jgi:type I restriction enzyme S subunit
MTQDRLEFAEDDPNQSETVRLKHLTRINPSKSEIDDVPPDTTISFVPLEGFGTSGTIESSEEKSIEEVYDGYTYFREGDITIAKITPSFENGKGAICKGLENGIGFGTTELHVLRPRENTDTGFLWYVLRAKPFMDEAETSMRGVAGQKRLKSQFIEMYRVPEFPLDRQEAIADFLDRRTARIDALVAKQRRLLDLLDEKRQAVITRAVTAGLDSTVAMKDTGVDWLGKIPEHWEPVRLKFLLTEIEQGWSPQCKDRLAGPDQWGVLKAGAAKNGRFLEQENKILPSDKAPQPEYEIQQGDLLMNRASGSPEFLGNVALVPEVQPQLLLCDKLFRLHVREGIASPEFLSISLRSHPLRHQIISAISGAEGLANNLPQAEVKELILAVPPLAEQKHITQNVLDWETEVKSLIQKIEKAIDRLKEKRQALITAAVTGQIDVTEERDAIQDHSV